MRRYVVAVLLALPLSAGALAAQQSPDARIDAAKRQAGEAGIPVSLLEARVAEGRAKGVPAERIAMAVERRAAALARAQQAMRSASALTEADFAAAADAVEAGIGEEHLRQVIQLARTEDRPVAIAVLTYLHRERGMPVDQALSRVARALGEGPDALRQLPAQAGAQARRGPPGGVGGPPAHAGQGGPPGGVPGPGQRPGSGKPAGAGKPGGNPGGGNPGGGNPGGGRPGGGL